MLKFFLNCRISATRQWTISTTSLAWARHCSKCWPYSRKRDKTPLLMFDEWSETHKAEKKIPPSQRFLEPSTESDPHGKRMPPLYRDFWSLLFSTHYFTGKIKSRHHYPPNTWLGWPVSTVMICKLCTYLWLYFSCFSSVHFPHYHLLLLLLPPKQRTLPNSHLLLLPGKNY